MQWNEKILMLNKSSEWEGGGGWLSAAFLRDILPSPAGQAAGPALSKSWDLRLTNHGNLFWKENWATTSVLLPNGDDSTEGCWDALFEQENSQSWPQPLPALLKPQQDLPSRFSWSQDSWSSFPQVNPCSRDGRAAHPVSLQPRGWRSTQGMLLSLPAPGKNRTSSASPITFISQPSHRENERQLLSEVYSASFASGTGIRSSKSTEEPLDYRTPGGRFFYCANPTNKYRIAKLKVTVDCMQQLGSLISKFGLKLCVFSLADIVDLECVLQTS